MMNHQTSSKKSTHHKVGMFSLALGSLGVVYGDIGTSPLYAVKEIFYSHGELERSNVNVLGSISLILWVLTLIIAVKYVFIVLKADNHGEGGVFALLSLIKENSTKLGLAMVGLLVLAGGLLFGDGVITPAISVTSAIEGLEIITPSFSRFVIPITIFILLVLFAFQSKGTHKVGVLFGPIIFIWFMFLGIIGLSYIIKDPTILKAFNPMYAIKFVSSLNFTVLLHVLGSVMLVLTGGEAMYADMGHFGKKAIRISWTTVVFPMLILAYLGQGAFMLSSEKVVNENVFYSMVPNSILPFAVILATFATIIASQALISGSFSLASQGVSLGLLPRLKIIHTYHESEGQIYIPVINWMLFAGCAGAVFGFKTSGNMAAAYGLTVSIVILMTTLGCSTIAYKKWNWKLPLVILVFGAFACIELMFIIANSIKFVDGGFIPIIVALLLFLLMNSWQWGRGQVRKYVDDFDSHESLKHLVQEYGDLKKININLAVLSPIVVTSIEQDAPPSLARFVERFEALPKRIVFISGATKSVPRVKNNKWKIVPIDTDHGIESLCTNFGFMDGTNLAIPFAEYVEQLDSDAKEEGSWVLFSGTERLIINPKTSIINKVRFYVYRTLYRNAQPAYTYYGFSRDKRVAIELIPAEIG